jgi:hypothetical protein
MIQVGQIRKRRETETVLSAFVRVVHFKASCKCIPFVSVGDDFYYPQWVLNIFDGKFLFLK